MIKSVAHLEVGDETEFGPVLSKPETWPNGRVYVGFPQSDRVPVGVRGFAANETIEVQS